MKKENKYIERFRIKDGLMGSDEFYGNNGVFCFFYKNNVINTIASDQMGWEHVSISLKHRCPTWEEMCHIKNLFWDECETVVQYHPKKSEYVNRHPFCLHLWKKINSEYELPPKKLIG